ncbi:hypothetical protein BOTBODRAFT_191777 [Botryobasidium botryosum FD-172 SS1]|uniref:Ricin B lectin domain-containing protein n=1 Tax=Botryobasidium botryosum (strain FD-172 SS1) TaxID=930990 RepID=A0A067M130_BOTB1|nr:hypothetical protein BOTBODRAFT_191777 [Botryobasidium botryosum FD-172 SS1]
MVLSAGRYIIRNQAGSLAHWQEQDDVAAFDPAEFLPHGDVAEWLIEPSGGETVTIKNAESSRFLSREPGEDGGVSVSTTPYRWRLAPDDSSDQFLVFATSDGLVALTASPTTPPINSSSVPKASMILLHSIPPPLC